MVKINKIPLFNNLKHNSLGKIYLDSKRRLQSKKVKHYPSLLLSVELASFKRNV